eukprot:TRINITY_DN13422_c0_g1_i1.p1 TRINITY_DN13422_c0_g1~~TRINITY_DN13422_c0_g1_i1.p1  ORF type:complete len:106 (-),score=14.85 TRINITY_DN13422_c0_g1_i1:92-409(-)
MATPLVCNGLYLDSLSMSKSSQTEPSPWWNGQLYFAHFAIQTDNQHQAFEKYGRSGQVKIIAQPFEARLDDWQLARKEATFLPLSLKGAAGKIAALIWCWLIARL